MITRLFALVSLCCAAAPLMATEPDRQCDQLVSVTELIADPGAYDGKVVWVSAMVTTGVEKMSACPSGHDSQTEHCLWVDIDAGPFETDQDFADYQTRLATLERFTLQAIAIHATFDSNENGHFGMWPDGFRNVTELSGRRVGWSFVENAAARSNSNRNTRPSTAVVAWRGKKRAKTMAPRPILPEPRSYGWGNRRSPGAFLYQRANPHSAC